MRFNPKVDCEWRRAICAQAMASYLGCLPTAAPGPSPAFLESTRSSRHVTGFFSHAVPEGMHYQGRRWGGSPSYDAHATFKSYGVVFDYTPLARASLIAALPPAHAAFLRELRWPISS